jgi:hypothetical protein
MTQLVVTLWYRYVLVTDPFLFSHRT